MIEYSKTITIKKPKKNVTGNVNTNMHSAEYSYEVESNTVNILNSSKMNSKTKKKKKIISNSEKSKLWNIFDLDKQTLVSLTLLIFV